MSYFLKETVTVLQHRQAGTQSFPPDPGAVPQSVSPPTHSAGLIIVSIHLISFPHSLVNNEIGSDSLLHSCYHSTTIYPCYPYWMETHNPQKDHNAWSTSEI